MNKPKFNLTDAVIILAAVLVICAAVMVLSGKKSGGSEAVNSVGVNYEIQLTKIGKATAEAFEAAKAGGETIYVGDKERVAAEFAELEITPAKKLSTNSETGEVFWAEIEGFYDAVLSLKSRGSETATEVCIDNTQIRVGDALTVRSKGAAGHGYVINLETVE